MNRVRGRIGELFVLGLGIGGGAAAVFALLSAAALFYERKRVARRAG